MHFLLWFRITIRSSVLAIAHPCALILDAFSIHVQWFLLLWSLRRLLPPVWVSCIHGPICIAIVCIPVLTLDTVSLAPTLCRQQGRPISTVHGNYGWCILFAQSCVLRKLLWIPPLRDSPPCKNLGYLHRGMMFLLKKPKDTAGEFHLLDLPTGAQQRILFNPRGFMTALWHVHSWHSVNNEHDSWRLQKGVICMDAEGKIFSLVLPKANVQKNYFIYYTPSVSRINCPLWNFAIAFKHTVIHTKSALSQKGWIQSSLSEQ